MGWASGTELAIEVWAAVKKHLPPEAKERVAQDIIIAFAGHDWDCINEAEDLCEAAGITYDEECGDTRYPKRLAKALGVRP